MKAWKSVGGLALVLLGVMSLVHCGPVFTTVPQREGEFSTSEPSQEDIHPDLGDAGSERHRSKERQRLEERQRSEERQRLEERPEQSTAEAQPEQTPDLGPYCVASYAEECRLKGVGVCGQGEHKRRPRHHDLRQGRTQDFRDRCQGRQDQLCVRRF